MPRIKLTCAASGRSSDSMFVAGEFDEKGCPFSSFGFDPDFAAGQIDYLFHNGETDAGPFHLDLFEPLKDSEYLFVIFGVDADSIVFDIELNRLRQHFSADLDSGMGLISHKLGRVGDEVLKNLGERGFIKNKGGKGGLNDHLDLFLGEALFLNIQDLRDDGAKLHRLRL